MKDSSTRTRPSTPDNIETAPHASSGSLLAQSLIALEPRYLFDAAAATTAAATAVDAAAQAQADSALPQGGATEDGGDPDSGDNAAGPDEEQSLAKALASHDLPAARSEIVFIDGAVRSHSTLLAGIDANAEVIVLDTARDGIEQIADVLRLRQNVDAVHIISHGEQARMDLGNTALTLDSMQGEHAGTLGVIGQGLATDADILIYGCNFGEGEIGRQAAELLAELTGADVAASEDFTGHPIAGGDWVLEVHTGDIEASTPISPEARARFVDALATLAGIPSLNFRNPTLESGTALQQGAVYRFSKVFPGFDALVEVTSINNGAELIEIDNKRGGIPAALQPKIKAEGKTDASIDFTITFVTAGTSTQVEIAEEANGVAVDVDGDKSNLREYVVLNGIENFTLENPTNLQQTTSNRFEPKTSAQKKGIDKKATDQLVSASYEEPEQITYTAGILNGTSEVRLFSFLMQPIDFDDPVTTQVAPDVNLDPNNSGGGANDKNFDATFTEKGPAVTVADTDATVTDANNTELASLSITPGGVVDGANEVLNIGGTAFPLNADSEQNVTVGGTTFVVSVTGDGNTINVSNVANADMPIADVQALVRTITYQNNASNPTAGVRTVEFRVNDAFTDSNLATSRINVVAVNDPPKAANDTSTGNAPGNAATVAVTSNDTDADGTVNKTSVLLTNPLPTGAVLSADARTLTVTGQGTWTVNATTGDITFTPETGYKGDPTPVSYTVKDNSGTTSPAATVTVDYDVPPVATNDAPPAGTAGNPVTVSPLTNDNDPDGTLDATSVVFTNPPAGGVLSNGNKTLTVPGQGTWTADTATGAITFTPLATFNGDPTPAQYTVKDNNGLISNAATVTADYTVLPVAANDNSAGNAPGATVNVNPLSNDNDPDESLDATSVVFTNPPAGGVLSNSNKTLTIPGQGAWTANATTGQITFTPATGFSGDPTPVQYTVNDNDGGTSNAATVTVDYAVPPVAANDAPPAGTAGNPVVFNPLTNDADADGTVNPATVVFTNPPPGGVLSNGNKTLTVPGQGAWTADPVTGQITFTPEAGFNGDPAAVQYTVNDNDGLTSVPATVTVDYNVPPVATNDASNDNAPGTAVALNPLTNDNDPDETLDPASVVFTNPPAESTLSPDGKTLTVPGQGTWTADPATGQITFTPLAGFNGDPTPVQYIVSDNDGQASNPATVTVDYAVPPVAVNDAPPAGTPGNPVVLNPLTNDSDPDETLDPATVEFTNPPPGGALSNGNKTLTVPGQGTWTADPATGQITFTPAAGFSGDPAPVQYTVKDNDGLKSGAATVTVDYNVPPVATNDASANNTPGATVTVNPVTNDNDPDETLNPASVVFTPLAGGTLSNANKTLTVAGQGTWTADPATGQVTFTPQAGFTGDPTPVQYTINDNDGLTSPAATITVDYDVPPVAANDTPPAGTPGNPVAFNPLANDTDGDGTVDPATVVLANPPAGANLSPDGKTLTVPGQGTWTVDPATGQVTFTPQAGFSGDPTPVQYTVKDNDGLASGPATLTVDYNAPPVASNDASAGNAPGTAVNLNPLANDSDPDESLNSASVVFTPLAGGTLSNGNKTLTVTGQGTWTADPATGQITFTPEAGFNGDPTPVQYTVNDNDGLTSDPATVTVDYSVPPVATNDSSTGNAPGNVAVNPLTNDSDPDAAPLGASVKLTNPPAGATLAPDGKSLTVQGQGTWTVDPVSGAITFAPNAGFGGDPSPVQYTLTDADGNTSAPATVTVDYDVAPTAANDTATGFVLGTAATVNPLTNDSDPDGTLNAASVVFTANSTQNLVVPGEGTWSIDGAGQITFTPLATFLGNPTPQTYTVNDNEGRTSNAATVTLTYAADANPPSAVADQSANNTPGAAVTVNPLTNDSDNVSTVATSVVLVNPPAGSTLSPDGKTLTVPNQGTWAVDPASGAITFTPQANFRENPDPVAYTVADNAGNVSVPATVTVLYADTPPLAANDTSTGNTPGTPVSVDPVANDQDPRGSVDPTSVVFPPPGAGVTQPPGAVISNGNRTLTVPNQGTWTANTTTGQITFTPEAGFGGDPAPIQYAVNDNSGNASNAATVTVDYSAPPVAVTDIATGNAPGTPVTVNPLSNDSDPDAAPVATSVKIVNPPAGGTLSPDGKTLTVPNQGTWSVSPTSGAVTFTPQTGFNGDPSAVQYTLTDADGNTSTPATLNVDYSVAPIAANDTSTGNAPGNPVTVNPLTNDSDPDGDPEIPLDGSTVRLTNPPAGTTLSPDGRTLTVPNQGTWTVNPTSGAVTFTPQAGFSGDPTPVQYTVSDADGNASTPATITADYNVAPVTANDTSTGNAPGTTVTVNPLANDNDPDAPLVATSVKLVNPPAGGVLSPDGKTLTVPGQGTWAVDPATGALTFTPEAGFNGDPTPVRYTLDDADDNTSPPATVTVDYRVAPVATNDVSSGNTPGKPAVLSPLANDTDSDGDPEVSQINPGTFRFANPPAGTTLSPDGQTLTVPGQGTWTFDPETNQVTFTPQAGFSGDPAPVQYTVADTEGNVSAPGTLTADYNVSPVTANDVSNGNVPGTPVTVNPLANDSDPDAPIDPANVRLTSPPPGATLSNGNRTLTVPGQGTWTVDPANGQITFTPQAGFTGDPTPVQYTVDDSDENTSPPATVTVNYSVGPVATNDVSSGNTPGQPATVKTLSNDNDPDAPLDPAGVRLTNPPAGSTLSPDGKALTAPGQGTWTVQPNGDVVFTPQPGFAGDPTPVQYTVADSEGNTSAPATITADYNSPPLPANDVSSGNTPGTTVTVNPLANDTDPDAPLNPSTLKLANPPAGGTLSVDGRTLTVPGQGTWTVNPANGEVTFTPESGFTGDPAPVQYTLDDADENTSPPATLTVDYDVPPLAASETLTGARAGDPATIDPLLNDRDPDESLDPSSVQLVNPPAGASLSADGKTVSVPGQGTWTVNPSTGAITFTPLAGFLGDPTPVQYTVKDNDGLASGPATVAMQFVSPPVVSDDPIRFNPGGQPTSLDPLANDSDPDSPLDPKSVRFINPRAGASLSADGKTLTVPGQGVWTADPSTGAVTFTGASGFVGVPSPAQYVIKDVDGLSSAPATISSIPTGGVPDNLNSADDAPPRKVPSHVELPPRDIRVTLGPRELAAPPPVINTVNEVQVLDGVRTLRAPGAVFQAVNGVETLDGARDLEAPGAVIGEVQRIDRLSLFGNRLLDPFEEPDTAADALGDVELFAQDGRGDRSPDALERALAMMWAIDESEEVTPGAQEETALDSKAGNASLSRQVTSAAGDFDRAVERLLVLAGAPGTPYGPHT